MSQHSSYDEAARRLVELGNELVEDESEADMQEVAAGLLAGAIHFWLYAHQPCEDPRCTDCASLRTAEWRLRELLGHAEEMARNSEYFHSPDDMTAGSA
ncbi:hypothetical protein M0534_07725 [Methylonatrum kenyense]|uniref:hypothetical protein n=1 Tax=Methylonatrum kenyense TaxID=455253 RepID=UPI0020BF74B8|nr:hypothetical protein [Methylonatrum kenyense]MCK8516213.1 hypothetical protein [Methylonatrum kenyense]